MENTQKASVNIVRMLIAALLLCAVLALLFYLRVDLAEELIEKCEEKEGMDNMIWLIRHLSAFIPSIAMIVVLTLFYSNKEKYVPIKTQNEKLIAVLLAAIFFFAVLVPIASSWVIPAVVVDEEVIEEETTLLNIAVNWFFVQIVPFIIMLTYHYARGESEKKALEQKEQV